MAGVQVTKTDVFTVLSPPVGANVTKVVFYAVLGAVNVTPPLWGSWTFANGVVSAAYLQSWDMPTSAEVVTYSVLSGSLPSGLTLTAGTHNVAQISGTPTAAGTFTFTLRAVNSAGTSDKAFTITISSASSGASGWSF